MQAQSTRCLRLPQQFNVAALQQDVQRLRRLQWIQHYNNTAHQGRWECLPLRAANGDSGNIFASAEADFMDTPLLQQCPAVAHAVAAFACDKLAVRLMSLAAGARILPHRDAGGGFEDGVARLHVPIFTDPRVLFEIDGETVHFGAGECWYMNANCLHAAHNGSPHERIHLVLDCVPNAWLRTLFTSAGWQPNPAPEYGDAAINDANIQQVISELMQNPSPAAQQLIVQLQQKVASRKA
ncbi:aspartyl/asparaginyl beta-hydroxylase domain-containing protein [Massilia sp. W12]|uniref:aspartyl/asparaginyl beta-hydroxylase domain-containing protein n=1 Tax=Massilia sp. W12 TaxID=3126507 RepID=UPI0030D3A402